jgi:hypothetical protein
MTPEKPSHYAGRNRDLRSPPRTASRMWRRAILIALPVAVVAAGGFALWRSQRANRMPPPALARAGDGVNDPAEDSAARKDEPLTFLVGAVADIAVRPTSLTGPVQAAAFWVRDNEALPWDAQVEQSGDGIVHLRGTIVAPWGGIEDQLAIVLTPPGTTPPLPAACKSPCEVVPRRVRYIRAIVPMVPAADATAP